MSVTRSIGGSGYEAGATGSGLGGSGNSGGTSTDAGGFSYGSGGIGNAGGTLNATGGAFSVSGGTSNAGGALNATGGAVSGSGGLGNTGGTGNASSGVVGVAGGTGGGAGIGATGGGQSDPDAGIEVLSLVAGGLGGPGAIDDIGTAARFNTPYGVAADAAGNVYVADTSNASIRKVAVATRAVTTLAGASGNTNSRVGIGAYGVAADGQGNLFVADTGDNTIRKIVAATGEVSILAGTPGSSGSEDATGPSARFNGPEGIALDGQGNLFVADTSNNTIRQVVIATGEVTTLAGTAGQFGGTDLPGADARFTIPSGVACDGAGNVYVADSHNATIRKIVVATKEVSTLAGAQDQFGSDDGTGDTARFMRTFGVTYDGDGNLFVADGYNATIRKVVIATREVTTLAGTAGELGTADGIGADARFSGLYGIASDRAGNLYVPDTSSHTLRKIVVATREVTTLAGAGTQFGSSNGAGAAARFNVPFGAPSGVVSDGQGNAYVVDTGNDTIRKVVLATGEVSTLAGTPGQSGSNDLPGAAARFYYPLGLTSDGAGNLYVADAGNHTIRKVVIATGEVSTLAGTAGQTGSVDRPGAAARFNTPSGVASDGAGNLFVADTYNDTIRKIVVATGEVSTVAGTAGQSGSTDLPGTAARFNFPFAISCDGSGKLYVADTFNNTIRKIVVVTGEVSTVAGTAGQSGTANAVGAAARFNFPYGLTGDGQGNLLVADTLNHAIRKIDLATGTVSTLAGVTGAYIGVRQGPLPGGLANPVGIDVAGSMLLFMDENSLLAIH